MPMQPVRRKWDYERRTTRWRAYAKIGTQPYGVVYFDQRPKPGEKRLVWERQGAREQEVRINRIVDDWVVLCEWV